MTTAMLTDYERFLESKRVSAPSQGIDIAESDINPKLYPFQRRLVQWALRKGRSAVWADCGLGKSFIQLEWARLTGERTLILAPLAVAQQTVKEAAKLGIDARYGRSQTDVVTQITITNYEMMDRFDASQFGAVVLDESSILKSYSGKTKQALIRTFENTPYRLCCTATPAPNDLLELGNHSEFLGIMPSNEMISRWFINNTMQAGDYRLKEHAAADFWRWLSTWAMSLGLPSDIGFEDDGFVLPPLNTIEHIVDAGEPPPPGGQLFAIGAPSATTIHKTKRHSAEARASKVAELVNADDDYWIVWCDTNYEADALKAVLPDAIEIRGSESVNVKEKKLVDFSEGRARVIITKPEIAGFGLNWQHCHNIVFVGLSYSFERYYQAVRRSWRFGQERPVNAHIVTTPYEQSIGEVLAAKGKAFDTMRNELVSAVRELQIDELGGRRELVSLPDPVRESGENWEMWLGDCVDVARRLPSDSMDFSICSPPFANLYIYSDSIADMGNSADEREFFEHYEYLIREQFRVTVPGRLAAVHCKDLPLYKGRDGAAGLKDFPGQVIRSFEAAGWTYHSRVTIWKDPVTEMQRTKNHGLLHKQLCKDSAASRQGMADYLIVFRKWTPDADSPKPVTNGHQQVRFNSYIGEDGPRGARDARDYSIQVWQRYASPVWFDINQMRVLNYRQGTDDKDEKHICPLQLDVIDRAIHLWTNPGDVVFSPFAGIGSEGYESVKMGRRFVGIELKDSYFATAVKHLQQAEEELNQGKLL